jgi:ribosomal-protein-alanine N-acetyltransferase
MSAVPRPFLTRVRPMQEADLDEVIAIEGAAYEFPWTQGIFRDCLRVGYACWTLEGRWRPDGYGVMSAAIGEAHILNVCVRPEERRQGYGRQILHFLLDEARRHGAQTVFLEVRPSNAAAIALYRTENFSEVGYRRGYYPARVGREDALIFARPLDAGE